MNSCFKSETVNMYQFSSAPEGSNPSLHLPTSITERIIKAADTIASKNPIPTASQLASSQDSMQGSAGMTVAIAVGMRVMNDES